MGKKRSMTAAIGVAVGMLVLSLLVYVLSHTYLGWQEYVSSQHKQQIKQIVSLACEAIAPIVEKLDSGETDLGTARAQAADIVRRMVYEDDFGMNYVFMRTFDGTVLAQPLDPATEGHNEWDRQDASGRFVVREQVAAALSDPEGAYVTYLYAVPGQNSEEEKVSFVKAVPSLQVYVGTGMYSRSSFLLAERLLRLGRSSIVLTSCLVLALSGLYGSLMTKRNKELKREIELRIEAEAQLSKEKEMLRITLESIGDGVLATDISGNITVFNAASERISGWSREEAVGKSCDDVLRLVNETTGKPVESPVRLVMEKGTVVGLANHTALIRRDGRTVSIADSAAPIRDAAGNAHGIVMVFRDVTQERAQQEIINYISYHDALTGLYNRRFVEEQLESGPLSSTAPLCVAMGDLNGLKLVNDAFGHSEGDRILKMASEAIKSVCRPGDIAVRWGGDEFLVLHPGGDRDCAEGICASIYDGCASAECSIPVSISLGCAVRATADTPLWEALKEAEERMYHAKLLESRSYRNHLVRTLSSILIEKSLETMEHAQRIQKNSLNLAKAMGLTAKETADLELLALLHDIGKVGVREDVLLKAGPLTVDEWEELARHSEIGYRIAQNTPEIAHRAEFILCHHERWDGTGYPQGLKGSEIPLLSRILAVADAFDAMTSPRQYNSVMTKEEALAELRRCAGSQFDPDVVEKFVNLADQMMTGQGDF